jgi:hypothetical protein
MLFNFSIEYAIRNVQGTQVGQKLNDTHQLLAYADDVNVWVVTLIIRKEIIENLIDDI